MTVALVRDDPARFAGLITATAAIRGLDPSLVEKDYWAVEALRAVNRGFDVTARKTTVHVQPIFKAARACPRLSVSSNGSPRTSTCSCPSLQPIRRTTRKANGRSC